MPVFLKKKYINDGAGKCSACFQPVDTAYYEYRQDHTVSRIYRCGSCGYMFAVPALLPEKTARQMDSIDDAELFHNPLLKWLHRELIVKREIRAVKRFLEKNRFTMLDIGCGTGWTSSIWKHAGADVVGLEPSAARSAVARTNHGLRVISGYIEDLPTSEKFDVIVMRHVLEHLPDPYQVLVQLRGNLNERGLVVLIVPNINCVGRYVFGKNWSWILPWHCNFFTPKSILAIAKRTGFTPVTAYQTPSPLWYPESFLRMIPGSGHFSTWLYRRLNLLALLLFAPLVTLGYLCKLSDNLTIIARNDT